LASEHFEEKIPKKQRSCHRQDEPFAAQKTRHPSYFQQFATKWKQPKVQKRRQASARKVYAILARCHPNVTHKWKKVTPSVKGLPLESNLEWLNRPEDYFLPRFRKR
jgi:hypothetical protein